MKGATTGTIILIVIICSSANRRETKVCYDGNRPTSVNHYLQCDAAKSIKIKSVVYAFSSSLCHSCGDIGPIKDFCYKPYDKIKKTCDNRTECDYQVPAWNLSQCYVLFLKACYSKIIYDCYAGDGATTSDKETPNPTTFSSTKDGKSVCPQNIVISVLSTVILMTGLFCVISLNNRKRRNLKTKDQVNESNNNPTDNPYSFVNDTSDLRNEVQFKTYSIQGNSKYMVLEEQKKQHIGVATGEGAYSFEQSTETSLDSGSKSCYDHVGQNQDEPTYNHLRANDRGNIGMNVYNLTSN